MLDTAANGLWIVRSGEKSGRSPAGLCGKKMEKRRTRFTRSKCCSAQHRRYNDCTGGNNDRPSVRCRTHGTIVVSRHRQMFAMIRVGMLCKCGSARSRHINTVMMLYGDRDADAVHEQQRSGAICSQGCHAVVTRYEIIHATKNPDRALRVPRGIRAIHQTQKKTSVGSLKILWRFFSIPCIRTIPPAGSIVPLQRNIAGLTGPSLRSCSALSGSALCNIFLQITCDV